MESVEQFLLRFVRMNADRAPDILEPLGHRQNLREFFERRADADERFHARLVARAPPPRRAPARIRENRDGNGYRRAWVRARCARAICGERVRRRKDRLARFKMQCGTAREARVQFLPNFDPAVQIRVAARRARGCAPPTPRQETRRNSPARRSGARFSRPAKKCCEIRMRRVLDQPFGFLGERQPFAIGQRAAPRRPNRRRVCASCARSSSSMSGSNSRSSASIEFKRQRSQIEALAARADRRQQSPRHIGEQAAASRAPAVPPAP